MGRVVYPTFINYLNKIPSVSAFVFVNFHDITAVIANAVEELLIKAKMNIDLLQNNWSIDTNGKFGGCEYL